MRPDAAPTAKACFRLLPDCSSGRLTAAPSGIFCSPMPRANASAPLSASGSPRRASAAARPTVIPSGRLWRVTASTIRRHFSALPVPEVRSRPDTCSSRSRPTAPSTSPHEGGIHAGSGPAAARSMAGSSRLQTLAASMMPAARPFSIRWVFGSCGLRSRNTPAAPSAVHAAGSSNTIHTNNDSNLHSPFPPMYAPAAERVQKTAGCVLSREHPTVFVYLEPVFVCRNLVLVFSAVFFLRRRGFRFR